MPPLVAPQASTLHLQFQGPTTFISVRTRDLMGYWFGVAVETHPLLMLWLQASSSHSRLMDFPFHVLDDSTTYLFLNLTLVFPELTWTEGNHKEKMSSFSGGKPMDISVNTLEPDLAPMRLPGLNRYLEFRAWCWVQYFYPYSWDSWCDTVGTSI